MITFFLAGNDTTAIILCWMWYLLALHPDVEAKLHKELDTVLHGRTATVDDLANLPYTEKIMTETLRLYPPIYATMRIAEDTHQLGEYIIPAGAALFVSTYLTHHNPKYFPNPEKFDPDRWTPEFKAQLPKFAYYPFGGGTRICIGEPFAWLEGILVLATIAQRWKLRLAPGQVVDIRPLVTLNPKGSMPMRLERREGLPETKLNN
jgi:cytochrome P450